MLSEDSPTPQNDSESENKDDHIRQGWILHVQGDFPRAEEDFRQAIATNSQSVEGNYGLGLALKLQQRYEEAIRAFQKTIELVNTGSMKEDPSRATMLRHLSSWHIKVIQSGNQKEPEP